MTAAVIIPVPSRRWIRQVFVLFFTEASNEIKKKILLEKMHGMFFLISHTYINV